MLFKVPAYHWFSSGQFNWVMVSFNYSDEKHVCTKILMEEILAQFRFVVYTKMHQKKLNP
jgi:hypothetical protein